MHLLRGGNVSWPLVCGLLLSSSPDAIITMFFCSLEHGAVQSQEQEFWGPTNNKNCVGWIQILDECLGYQDKWTPSDGIRPEADCFHFYTS